MHRRSLRGAAQDSLPAARRSKGRLQLLLVDMVNVYMDAYVVYVGFIMCYDMLHGLACAVIVYRCTPLRLRKNKAGSLGGAVREARAPGA
jgi:hypothetical protein